MVAAMKFRVHHVAISVADINRSVEFYANFGFKELIRWPSVKGGLMLCHLQLDGTILELFCYERSHPAPEASKALSTDLPEIGVKHFALQVASIDDAYAFLRARELIDEVGITRGGNGLSYFFVPDPDNILLEFIEDSRALRDDAN